jgi:hypothetical protein
MKHIDIIDSLYQLYRGGKIDESRKKYIDFIQSLLSLIAIQKEIDLDNKEFKQHILELKLTCNKFPDQAYFLFEESIDLSKKGLLHKALIFSIIATELRENFAEAYYHCANLCLDVGFLVRSIEYFNKFINLAPAFPDAFLNKGLALQGLKRFDEAISAYDQAIKINPSFAAAYNNRGNAFFEAGEFQKALLSYEQAINVRINYVEAINNKGVVLKNLERLDEALQSFDQAININQNYAEAYANIATVYEQKKMYPEALKNIDISINLLPELHAFKFNKGMLCLKLKNFELGLELYESRLKIVENKIYDSYAKKLTSHAPIQGKKILVYSEQGFGDTLQFFRYIPILQNLGAEIFFETRKSLVPLLKNSNHGIHFIVRGDDLPEYDYYCSLLSLPYLFKEKFDKFFSGSPYIFAEEPKIKLWEERLGPRTKFRVGLVWSGGFRSDQPNLWAVNKRRNIELSKFKSFADLKFIEFYSIQKGKEAELELEKLIKQNWGGPSLLNFTDEIIDFSDTAALISHLDLVISVDTSTAHLSAAMGKPTWILNRYDSCWRWFDDGSNYTPWYQSVRLFRQSMPNDWSDVIIDVEKNLKKIKCKT